MDFSIYNRQDITYLKKEFVTEIKLNYKDYRAIPDYIDTYKEKDIVCQITFDVEEIDWDYLENCSQMSPEHFICCISRIEQGYECKNRNIKFYYGYEINTYYDLRTLIDFGVCYVRLGAPLFFDLKQVRNICKQKGIKIRAIANIADDNYMPERTGIHGCWIRPEDVETYEDYIDLIEFDNCNLSQEQALYRIYAEQKKWPGAMDMIIQNFKNPAINRLIPPELAQKRLNCNQICERGNSCHLCDVAIKLANEEILTEYLSTIEEN